MFGDEAVTREILGNVPAWLVACFYVSVGIACAGAALGFYRRWRSYDPPGRRGAERDGSGARFHPGRSGPGGTSRRARWGRVARSLIFQDELRRDPFAGWAHLLTVHGFIILFIGTCLVFLEHQTPLHFFYGWFYQAASLVIDLGGAAFIAGLTMFLWRRWSGRSPRILRAWWVTALSVLLLAVGVSGFLLEGARIAIDLPEHEWCSPVGYAVALGLRAGGIEGSAAARWQQWLWGGHAAVSVAFFALLPWAFFSHMIYGMASWTARADRPLSRLPVLPLAPEQPPGAATWRDFSKRDLLQVDACTTCGRCNEVCPAHAAGKPLQPRDVVLALWRRDDDGGEVRSQSFDDVLWSCTTCAACNNACPVGIDVYDKIVELRRGRVESGRVPEAAESVFNSVALWNNPFDKPTGDRLAWAQDLNVPVARPGEPIDLLYWIGCAGSFSPEGQSVARAMIKILNHLRVDYRVLGPAERCTGDPARRMGEEGLFQDCATQNLRTLRSHGVKRVLTHCPHCFNAIGNEYREMDDGRGEAVAGDGSDRGGTWQTLHHTEFLAEQIAAGRLKAAAGSGEAVTFHDPCYLGRGNGIVNEPRAVLNGLKLPAVEMPRHGADSFCCGAGGGSLWLDVRGRDRIENQRYEEAAATGARVVATGCPFCKTMLEAARQTGSPEGRSPRVMDLAELVAIAEGL